MTVVDLFAGPGGWDVAARRLGMDPDGYELDDAACATRRAAGLRTNQCDVAAVDLSPETGWEPGRYRGLIASPPCQAFSTAGKRKGVQDQALINRCAIQLGRGRDERAVYQPQLADDRSLLVVEPLRWALALKPEWLAWEQVPPVLGFWELCAKILRRHGYHVWTGCLQAEQFGVPQTRKRAFLIASLAGPVAPPEPTHSRYYPRNPGKLDMGVLPWVSMAEALGWGEGLVGFPRKNDRNDGGEYRARDFRETGQPAFNLTEKARSWTLHTNRDQREDGSRQTRSADVPAPAFTAKSGSQWTLRSNARANSAVRDGGRPAPTITAGHDSGERIVDNGTEQRKLRVDEAAALQSFPADHPWQGSRTAQFLQVGNAIPPRFAEAVLRAAMRPGVKARYLARNHLDPVPA